MTDLELSEAYRAEANAILRIRQTDRPVSRERLVEAIDLVSKLAQLQSGPVAGGGLSAMQKAQFAAREVAIAEFVAACDQYVKVWGSDAIVVTVVAPFSGNATITVGKDPA